MTRKVGKFIIDGRMIDRDQVAVQAVFARCIPVRAEHLWHSNCFEYVAVSDDFEEVGQGELTPTYRVTITVDPETEARSVSFERIEGNGLP